MKKTLKYIYLNYLARFIGIALTPFVTTLRFFYLFKLSFYNKFNKFLIFNFGITYENLLDGFFFGSIVLLFFRLTFRLIFFYDPFWFFNLSLYVFSVLFQLKYDFMYYIRYVVIVFLKKFLGHNYFNNYIGDTITALNKKLKGMYTEKAKIKKSPFYHKFFQFLFTFCIFFRLWSFKSPIKFFIFIFFINFLLIFNNFFLFSSFFSFIIIFSRLAIFATKFNSKAFFGLINYCEAIDLNDKYIITNWYNAKVISLIVAMNLSFSMTSLKKHEFTFFFNEEIFYEKYIELYPFFDAHYKDLSHSSLFQYNLREAYHLNFLNGDHGASYLPLLQLKKKKFNLEKMIFCGFPFSSFVWYKFSGNYGKLPKEIDFANSETKNHPTYFFFNDAMCGWGNKSTYRAAFLNHFLAKFPEKSQGKYTGRSFLRSLTVKQLELQHIPKIKNYLDLFKTTGDLSEIMLPPTYVPHFKSAHLPIWLKTDSMLYKLNAFTYTPNVIAPSCLNCIYLFLNPLATKEQILEGLDAGIIYLKIMLKADLQFEQILLYNKLLIILTGSYEEIKTLNETLFYHSRETDFEFNTVLLQEINDDLINVKKPSFKCIIKTLERCYNSTDEDLGVIHINNLHLLSKKQGGQSNSHMVYKNITNEIIIHKNIEPPTDPPIAYSPALIF